MSESILVTGGSGFIGAALVDGLLSAGHSVTILTRQSLHSDHPRLIYTPELGEGSAWPYTQIINLQGENLFGARWTSAYKQRLRDSRIAFTEGLVKAADGAPKLNKLISASAIGYYGNCPDSELGEDSPCGSDFAAKLCRDWEHAARTAGSSGIDVQILRIGVVLGDGGALDNLLPPFRFCLGGPIGHGKQWFSWIHRSDLVRMICASVSGELRSPVLNATAPEPVRNRDFARALGAALGRPAILPMPAVALRVLLGESADILTGGQCVMPKAALAEGFVFNYPDIHSALRAVLSDGG